MQKVRGLYILPRLRPAREKPVFRFFHKFSQRETISLMFPAKGPLSKRNVKRCTWERRRTRGNILNKYLLVVHAQYDKPYVCTFDFSRYHSNHVHKHHKKIQQCYWHIVSTPQSSCRSNLSDWSPRYCYSYISDICRQGLMGFHSNHHYILHTACLHNQARGIRESILRTMRVIMAE